MHWNLWLAQPQTERSLKSLLRIAAAVVACWTLAAAYGMWSARAALAAAQVSLVSQSSQISQIASGLPEKRRLSKKAAEVQVISSQGGGSAELTQEFADLARRAGAELRGVQIGDGKQGSATAQAASAPAATGAAADGTANTAAQASAATGSQETFECSIAGQYPALTHFLSGLAASRHRLDVTSLQVTQSSAKAQALRLEMKINGIVYEAASKQ